MRGGGGSMFFLEGDTKYENNAIDSGLNPVVKIGVPPPPQRENGGTPPNVKMGVPPPPTVKIGVPVLP